VDSNAEVFCGDGNGNVLLQGDRAGGKSLKQFETTVHSIVFETVSFCSGVDVSGEALSTVIVTRQLFAVLDHPSIRTKVEVVQAWRRISVKGYSLPAASPKTSPRSR